MGKALVGNAVDKVLVVDDDAAIRETLRLVLEDAGYTVEEAGDGLAALHLLRAARKPMVVLLDLMMPGLDGAGLLGTVAGDHRLAERFAYVLVTANNKTLPLAFANLLRNLDVQVVTKPFDVDQLLSIVDQAAKRLAS
jgi:CheY-like chemotaxis protein